MFSTNGVATIGSVCKKMNLDTKFHEIYLQKLTQMDHRATCAMRNYSASRR
jgi:hypothetical protein